MTALLASQFDELEIDHSDPSNHWRFFSDADRTKIRNRSVKTEFPPKLNPAESCNTNLFFGFFHDGTRNNYGKSIENELHDHTNIARLYSCYPGRRIKGVVPGEPEWKYRPNEFRHFFRVYTPGVGTAFDLVNDSGKGKDRTLGGAVGYKGEPRIIWSLLQTINNLHRFFKNDEMLITASEAKALYNTITLNRLTLQEMTEHNPSEYLQRSPRMAFESILRRLHKSIEYNMRGADGCKPRNTDPGLVQEIFVSAFGFSRGAAAARVFANWLVALCKLDAQLLNRPGTTLGGFPVNFDFLGLFDTVASVGLGNTLNTANGHWQWADAEVSLRVPREFSHCLHLVSGHEVRRSFPLDSICYNEDIGAGRSEVVYPGVHSDVGGGYNPMDHGKGKDATGMDMLSRLPLAHMYRAARLAGVPLKLELVEQQSVKDDFRIAPDTIAAFNRYLSHAKCRKGSLTEIMREQCKFHMLWRRLRRQGGPAPLESIASYANATQEHKNDLRCANKEFSDELEAYQRWRTQCLEPAATYDEARKTNLVSCRPEDLESPRPAGFNNQREEEWMEISRFWDSENLPEGMETFFDNYVHDSRASFKLTGRDTEEVHKYLQALVRQLMEHELHDGVGDRPDPLTPIEREWATHYMKTGKVPEMDSDGREPALAGAGYLRYRKVYAGSDSRQISLEDHRRRSWRLVMQKRAQQKQAA